MIKQGFERTTGHKTCNVWVYVNHYLYGYYQINVTGNGSLYRVNNFAGIQNITGIQINPYNWHPVYSHLPLYYDDFTFTPDMAVGITNPRVNQVPNGSTQNAVVGVDIPLSASVSPSSRTGGSYSWTFTGPYTLISGAANSSSVTIRANDVGSISANVSYTLNGVTATSGVNINSVLPTLTSYSAQVVSADQIYRSLRCSGVFADGAIYSVGCALPNQDGSWELNSGIIFTATAQIPSGTYLTDPAQAGIKFKQYVSQFRKRILDVDEQGHFAFGQLQCKKGRSSEIYTNRESGGWQVDGAEAYGDPFIRPVPRFSQGNTLTYTTFDAPAQTLDNTFQIATPFPHMVDAFYANERFEMYVDYFVGSNPHLPSFKRSLRLASDSNSLYHYIPWGWGGEAYYDAGTPTTRYRLHTSITNSLGSISATGTNSIVTSQGNVSESSFGICPGGVGPTNIRIDGARYFTLQLYFDALNRTADQGGWNGWTSVIAQCRFDQNCVNNMRIAVARGFLESPASLEIHPLPPNPGSHEYNRKYVEYCYNVFLRRDPDQPAWDWYTNYLDTNGDYNGIISAFINSGEYRYIRVYPDRSP